MQIHREHGENRENRTPEEDVIQRQLTLRAVVWNVPGAETGGSARLNRELECYHVLKLTAREEQGRMDKQQESGWILQRLFEAGVSQTEALLVTGDAELAGFMHRQTKLAVIYYEADGGAGDVSADFIVQGFEEIGVQFLDRIQKRRNRLPWNILYTPRTCVREITLSDLDELFELYSKEGITDYTEPLFERPKEEEYVKSYIDCMYYFYGYGMWVIRDRKSGKLIGRAGIEHRDCRDRVLMELGYIIGREYQNQGYATEVCRAILEYAAENLEIEEMHCFIHPENNPSIRVAEKLGFRLYEGTERRQEELLCFYKRL